MKEIFGIRSPSGWLLLFPCGLWTVADIYWWPLDGGCYFLMASGWLLIFLDGLLLQPMPGAHSLTHRNLQVEGNIWYEVGLPNLSTSNLSPPKLFPPPGICLRGLDGCCEFLDVICSPCLFFEQLLSLFGRDCLLLDRFTWMLFILGCDLPPAAISFFHSYCLV